MPLARRRHLVCLVTDGARLAQTAPVTPLADFVGAAAVAGVDLIQIRERHLDGRGLTQLVTRCVAAAAGTTAKVIVNDRLDIALAAGAHGVHLRSDSISAPRVRELSPPGFIVGQSVHGVADVTAVSCSGAVDYLILGTLFPTVSKDPSQRLTSMTALAAAAALAAVPVLGIGGVTIGRACEIVKAGGAGIAAIGLFLPPAGVSAGDHLRTCVAELRRVFDTCEALP
jgi:thiamine-phosphate diphosphorylase